VFFVEDIFLTILPVSRKDTKNTTCKDESVMIFISEKRCVLCCN